MLRVVTTRVVWRRVLQPYPAQTHKLTQQLAAELTAVVRENGSWAAFLKQEPIDELVVNLFCTTSLHYIIVRCMALYYITLRHITLHYI